jgi:hypothetical protein
MYRLVLGEKWKLTELMAKLERPGTVDGVLY